MDQSYIEPKRSPEIYFTGIVEYHIKRLEIGWEHDETLFVGFILHSKDTNNSGYYSAFPTVDDLEIIGNIYENPELMNGEQEQKNNKST